MYIIINYDTRMCISLCKGFHCWASGTDALKFSSAQSAQDYIDSVLPHLTPEQVGIINDNHIKGLQ